MSAVAMLLAAALVLACCAPRDGAVSGGYVGAGAGATFRDRPMAR